MFHRSSTELQSWSPFMRLPAFARELAQVICRLALWGRRPFGPPLCLLADVPEAGVGVHFLPKVALVTIGSFKIRDLRYPDFPAVQYGGRAARAAQNPRVAQAFAATRNRNRYF
jgi:hypothetical protein